MARLLAALTFLATALAHSDRTDFAFDTLSEETAVTAVVGKVFRLAVTKDFTRRRNDDTTFYEAKVDGRRLVLYVQIRRSVYLSDARCCRRLPSWLLFDKTEAVFWGVPFKGDGGTYRLTVHSSGDTKGETRKFDLTVIETEESTAEECAAGEERTTLALLLDVRITEIKPKQRVVAVNNIAKFFGLPYVSFFFINAATPRLHSFLSSSRVPSPCRLRRYRTTSTTTP